MKDSYNYLNNLLKDGDIVIAAISYGPDSMALLYLLLEVSKHKKIHVVCAHVNHNLRKESYKEKEDLEEYCKKNNILFESMLIEKYSNDNLENEARHIRYRYFEQLVNKYNANYLMTAHHGDDLIETIMMRLARGSTLKGYSGFSQIVSKDNYKIVRPLIYTTKESIIAFNKEHNISYAIDKSNTDTKYTRNRYRKYMLPFLKKEDKNIHLKFLKFSKLLLEYTDYIDNIVSVSFNKVFNNNKLDLNKYNELDPLLKKEVLFKILENIYNDDLILINDNHVNLLNKIINSRKKNIIINLPNEIKVIKSYNSLEFTKDNSNYDNYNIELTDYVILPNGKHLEIVDSIDTNGNDVCRLNSKDVLLPLYVRTRCDGDKIDLMGSVGHRKVKDILIDKKINMKDRDLWPIVTDSNNEIVWIPGLKKSKFNKKKDEKCDIIIKYY